MKILKIGEYPIKELAEWFGIAESSFRNQKKKRLEELKIYADYEIKSNKTIKIKEVYADSYMVAKSNYKQIRDKIDECWDKNGDTCKRVSSKIEKELDLPIVYNTMYNYTCKSKRELYGVPFKSGGIEGKCFPCWKKVAYDENGEEVFISFTEEEEMIRRNLIKLFFGGREDDAEKELAIAELVDGGILSKEEGYDLFMEMRGYTENRFRDFVDRLEEAVGMPVKKVTMLRKWDEIEGGMKEFGEE